ncbi:hypothetical protein ACWDYJ_35795 [Streptomyces sp. NPDC003042]
MAERRQGWEQRNHSAYGTQAWRRAVMTCGALVVWHTGYDNRTVRGPGGPRPGRPHAPDGAEFAARWMPVAGLLALAACRAAREADVLVDDVELGALLGWVDGAYTHRLHEGPLDTGEVPERTADGWIRLIGDGRRRCRARLVVVDHLTAHLADEGAVAETRDGMPPPPLTLGHRARAVRAGGIPDLEPQWVADVASARTHAARLARSLHQGLWRPTPDHRDFARILHATLAAEPDYPDLPDGEPGPAWIQRLLRMSHIESTVLTLTALPAYAPFGPAAAAADPLGLAVGALVHTAVHSLAETARDLERLWAARSDPVAVWERAHLPPPLRTQVVEVEQVTAELCTLLFEIAHPGPGW